MTSGFKLRFVGVFSNAIEKFLEFPGWWILAFLRDVAFNRIHIQLDFLTF